MILDRVIDMVPKCDRQTDGRMDSCSCSHYAE